MLASIRHVDIVVNSLEKSLPFYRKLFKLLSWQKEGIIKGEKGESVTYFAGPQKKIDCAVGIRERQSKDPIKPYDRYEIGLHHLAFDAPSKELVDKCAQFVKNEGLTIESGPANYYQDWYGGDYYAVFFYGPDGLKLEVVYGDTNE